ncbi:hypothetical protein EP7_004297 [Isosphaeraceae bacterium EP7]
MTRALVVFTCLYVLLRHPLFWGDVLWAARAGESLVSSLAKAEGSEGPERCVPRLGARGWELCINGSADE